MQDISGSTSKQIKIYLRRLVFRLSSHGLVDFDCVGVCRSSDYFITVQRRGNRSSSMSCSYGLSVGSIEGAVGTSSSGVDNSASCAFLGLMSPDSMGKSDENQTRVPYCRDVMPGYTAVSKTDTSVQAIYIASLIGVGILSLGLMVLGGVLFRRWRRRKMDDMEQGMIKGVLPGPDAVESDRSTPTSERSNAVVASDGKGSEDGAQSKALVPAAVVPRQPDTARDGRGKGAKIRVAAENRSQAERIKRRLAKVGDEEEEEEGESQERPVGDADDPGSGAGVIGGASSVRRAADLRGGAGGLVLGMGSSGRMSQTPSPGADLYGDRRTAQSLFGRVPTPPGSAGSGSGRDSATGSRGPTPPEGRRTKRPSPRAGVAAGTESRPNSTGLIQVDVAEDGDGGPAGELWEDGTGIRIDDILEEARAASMRRDQSRQPPPPPPWKVSSVGTGWGGDRAGTESRASSGGSKVVASGPGGVVAAGEGSGSGSGSGGGGGSPHGSAADGMDGAASHPSEAGSPGPGSTRVAAAIAPHLSARLGMTGLHALPPRAPPSHRRPVLSSLGSNPPPPPPPRQQGESPAPRRTVALVQYPARDLASRLGRELPRAGQAGVPPPPARPLPRAGEAGVPPPPPGRPRGKADASAAPRPVEVRDTTASPGAAGGGGGPAAISSAVRPGGQGRDGRGMTTLRPMPGASPPSPPDAAGGF
jgi:hypothetical protein